MFTNIYSLEHSHGETMSHKKRYTPDILGWF